MKKKINKLDELNIEGKHPIIELFFDIARLKNLYRQGWLRKGVDDKEVESVAEHSFSVAMLSMVIAEEYFPDMNIGKVLKMALLHDMAEARAGDFTPHDDIGPAEKRDIQKKSAYEILENLPNFEVYREAWQEFFDQESKEARLVRQVDKLEMAMQANLYEKMGYQGLEEFHDYCISRIDIPELKLILEKLK